MLDKAGDSPLNHCIYFYIIDVHNGLCRVVAGHPMKKGCDDRYDKQRYHYNYHPKYCTGIVSVNGFRHFNQECPDLPK